MASKAHVRSWCLEKEERAPYSQGLDWGRWEQLPIWTDLQVTREDEAGGDPFHHEVGGKMFYWEQGQGA